VPLVDHHAHSVVHDVADRGAFEQYLTESRQPAGTGCSYFDSLLGASLLRACAPVLDLPFTAGPDDYVARRLEIGGDEANRRLLRAAGLEQLLVDHGFRGEDLADLAELADMAGAPVWRVVRLEHLAETLGSEGANAPVFADRFAQRLNEEVSRPDAVACKSVLAYRHGLDVDPTEPGPGEVRQAAEDWLSGARDFDGRPDRWRLTHPVLLRHLVWAALRAGAPLQFHTGYGDADLELHRANPALLTGLVRRAAPLGVPIMLLHCYPYHREAAYLAGVYAHVYLDVGLAVNYVGYRAPQVLAEALETAPFHKLLYSSDAFGLAELHLLAAVNFRRALAAVLEPLTSSEARSEQEVARIAALIGAGNARRVYRLPGESYEAGP
jgi:uncharacterized protein